MSFGFGLVPSFFWLLALVHGVTDLSLLRPGQFSLAEPRPRRLNQLLRHWLLLAVLTAGWMVLAWFEADWQQLGLTRLSWPAPWVAGLVLTVHLVIDLAGRRLVKAGNRTATLAPSAQAWAFVGIEALHLVALLVIAVAATSWTLSPLHTAPLGSAGTSGPLLRFSILSAYPHSMLLNWLLAGSSDLRWAAAAVCVWVIFGGAILIRLALATPRLRLQARLRRQRQGDASSQLGDAGRPDIAGDEQGNEVNGANSAPDANISVGSSSTPTPTSTSSPAPSSRSRRPRPDRATEATQAAGAAGAAAGAAETEQVGVYIGLLERLLTLAFFVMGQPTAVGFLVAAKSIARYKELEDREFAEYYLIGTLLSFALAIAGFLVLQVICLGSIAPQLSQLEP